MKSRCDRTKLSGAGCSIVLALAGTPAFAEEAAKPAGTGLEEVTVTARRVSENLQRVPIAVSVLSGDDLDRQDVHSFSQATRYTPGFDTGNPVPSSSATNAFTRMRGIAGVVTYFADVPKDINNYSALFDVANFQVLKGPQGTLFGLASNAGAMTVQPREPDDEFGGYINTSVGEYDRRSVSGAINIPLFDNRVLIRLAAETFSREGYVVDIVTGRDRGREQYEVYRPSMTFKITENLENYTMFNWEHNRALAGGNNTPETIQYFNFSPTAQFPLIGVLAGLNGMTREQFDAARDQVYATQLALGPYRYNGDSAGCAATATSPATLPQVPGALGANVPASNCQSGYGLQDDYMVVNRTTWSFGNNFVLKNIFGRSWSATQLPPFDQDATRLLLADTNPKDTGTVRNGIPSTDGIVTTDELQLSGKLLDDRLDFVTGVFTRHTHTEPYLFYTSGPGNRFVANLRDSPGYSKRSTRNYSGYAQGNYDLGPWIEGLTVTGGVRYSHDEARQQVWNLDPTTLAVTSVVGGPNSPAGHGKWTAVSYTAGLQYQYDPDTMFFITNAKGYSAGGLQNIPGYYSWDPDSLTNLEAGVKTTLRLGDLEVRANTSAYYGWYEDVIINPQVQFTNPATGQTSSTAVKSNAGEARIYGAETELTAVYGDSIELGGFFGYSHANYTKYNTFNAVTGQQEDISDTPWTILPKYKWGFNATYHLPISKYEIGDMTLRADVTGQSQTWGNVGLPGHRLNPANPNTGVQCKIQRTQANGYGPLTADGGWIYRDCNSRKFMLDLRLGWDDMFGRSGLSSSITVTNVTNRNNIQTVGYGVLGFELAIVTPPRMWRWDLGYSF